MRRMIVVMACVAMLVLAGSTMALAKGPHHGGGRGPGGYGPGRGYDRGHHHQVHRHGHRPYYVARPPRVVVPACPVPVPVAPVYPAYPRLGFGLGGSNFSFWFQQ